MGPGAIAALDSGPDRARGSQSDDLDGLAEAILSAVKSGKASTLKSALRTFVDACGMTEGDSYDVPEEGDEV